MYGKCTFPSSVRIGGIWYKIKLIARRPVIDGDNSYCAAIFYNDAVIKIWNVPTLEQRWKSLWHEIYHAFLWEYQHSSTDDHEYTAQMFAVMMSSIEFK